MEWTAFIPWAIALGSLIVAILTFNRNGKKDEKNELTEELQKISDINTSLLKVNLKLDQVCATTNETRSDIKSMKDDMSKVEKRVTVLEENVKAAWLRIDELKEAVKHEQENTMKELGINEETAEWEFEEEKADE